MEANRSLRFNTKKQAETFIVDQGVNGGFAVIGSAHWIPDVWLVDVKKPMLAILYVSKEWKYSVQETINWNKQYNTKYAKYEKDIEKYMVLL